MFNTGLSGVVGRSLFLIDPGNFLTGDKLAVFCAERSIVVLGIDFCWICIFCWESKLG